VKFSGTTRTSAFVMLLITVMTVGIGGYSAVHTRNAEIAEINASLNFVAQSVFENPEQPVGAALFAIEQSTLDVTLTLLTRDRQETLINDSSLPYMGAPDMKTVEEAASHPVHIAGPSPFQLRSILISTGDYIIIAQNTRMIDRHFAANISSVALFTFLVDGIAALLLFFYFRRINRRDQVASLERMQEFLGDASHELRTPLTVVKGYVEMLSKKQLIKEEDQERAFLRVGNEINRMEDLIQDLLLLAELGESGGREIERINLSELLTAHSTDFKTLNVSRSVIVEFEPDLQIMGSHDYLARFIQNALTNIMRHTDQNVSVRISCSKSGKSAIMQIEDAGTGLPDGAYGEDLRSLNRFDKSRSREHGGSGLGMSIMSAVIEKLHGKLSLRKSSLGGLAVVVDLALSKD
jgi:signal transduction histidine kinase